MNQITQYKSLINLEFDVRTDGKKIKTWDAQHKVDYIINCNKTKVIESLKLYNNYVIWWNKNSRSVIKDTRRRANNMADSMIILGRSFRNRMKYEIDRMEQNYNPDNITFVLKTYTFHSNTAHYNPNTREWWHDASPIENTFYKSFKPNEILVRVEVLSQYNFEMTEYQYNCDNQRKLMTQELREQIIERDESICQICHKKCRRDEIEIDHIKPVSKGGKTTASNLQVLCSTCNRQKSNKWLDDIELIYSSILDKKQDETIKVEEYDKKWESFNKKYNEVKYNNLLPKDKCVEIGDTVVIKYVDDEEELELKLVDKGGIQNSSEVTIDSPIGQAIYGQTVGDELDVKIPKGITSIKIIKLIKKDKAQ